MDLLLVAVAGFAAAFVDGALGMGFGPTSSSILLSQGYAPSVVSTTVNLAKVTTGLAAAVSHWRFNNIDHRLVLRLALPGCLGAIIGVTVLANVDQDTLRPVLAGLLLLVGLRILLRFSRRRPLAADAREPSPASASRTTEPINVPTSRGVEVSAAAGGVTNGLIGAWGPVVTPYLLHKGVAPRYSVGSVNTAEVAVAVVSAGSLIAALGSGGVDVAVLAAMLVGGVTAAPLAAWVIRHIPARDVGLAVAALLLVTNTRELASWADLGSGVWIAYGVIALLVTAAALRPRLTRQVAPADTTLDQPERADS